MHFTFSSAVFAFMIVYGFSTAALVVTAILAAMRGRAGQVEWRTLKAISAVLSGASLLLFLLGLQGTVSRLYNSDTERLRSLAYIDLREYITSQKIRACASNIPDNLDKNTCFDLQVIENSISNAMRENKVLVGPTNWAKNPFIEEIKPELMRRINNTNDFIRPLQDDAPIVEKDTYAKAILWSAFALALSLVFSIGEAVFQLRRAREDRKMGPHLAAAARKQSALLRRLRLQMIGLRKRP